MAAARRILGRKRVPAVAPAADIGRIRPNTQRCGRTTDVRGLGDGRITADAIALGLYSAGDHRSNEHERPFAVCVCVQESSPAVQTPP